MQRDRSESEILLLRLGKSTASKAITKNYDTWVFIHSGSHRMIYANKYTVWRTA